MLNMTITLASPRQSHCSGHLSPTMKAVARVCPSVQRAKKVGQQCEALRASRARGFDLTPAEAASVQQFKGDDDGRTKVATCPLPTPPTQSASDLLEGTLDSQTRRDI